MLLLRQRRGPEPTGPYERTRLWRGKLHGCHTIGAMRGSGAPCLAYVALSRLPAVKWATKVELYRMLVRGRAYLAGHYANGATVAKAAEAACMSPYHFNRLFRALFRETPGEYVMSLRLFEARRLLRTTDLGTGDIAFQVGLLQASSFSRLFRQRYGMTPSEYRRSVTG
jgi:AraC-like DNA-binding protein